MVLWIEMKKIESFEDTQAVLENYKTTIANCVKRSTMAQKLSTSANARSNDNAKEINNLTMMIGEAFDRITETYNEDKAFLKREIEELKKPWYKKLLCKLKRN